MEQVSQISSLIALGMGMAWASGINLYAALLTLGVLSHTGNMVLPESLQVVGDPLVMGVAGVMYTVEFFADKFPGVDTFWDAVQSFVRIPGGAILAAAAFGELSPAATLAAGLLGGGLAAGTHAAKAGTRVMINTSPEPVSNWSASLSEDVAVVAGVWTALNHPWLFLLFLVMFIILLAWLLPRLWKAIGAVFRRIRALFTRPPENPASRDEPPPDKRLP